MRSSQGLSEIGTGTFVNGFAKIFPASSTIQTEALAMVEALKAASVEGRDEVAAGIWLC